MKYTIKPGTRFMCKCYLCIDEDYDSVYIICKKIDSDTYLVVFEDNLNDDFTLPASDIEIIKNET